MSSSVEMFYFGGISLSEYLEDVSRIFFWKMGPALLGNCRHFCRILPPVVEVIRNSNEDAVGRRQSCPNASVYRPCPCRLCLHRSENSRARSTTPTSTPSTGRICHLYGNTQLLGTLLNWGHNVIYRGYCCRLCLTKCAL